MRDPAHLSQRWMSVRAVMSFVATCLGKSQKPHLLVIVPVFNGEEKLKRALHSVDVFSMECKTSLVVCDDGSEDNSISIALKFRARNLENFRVVKARMNYGLNTMRNLGLVTARDLDYTHFTFLDYDDVLQPVGKRLAKDLRGDPELLRGQIERYSKENEVSVKYFAFAPSIYNRRLLDLVGYWDTRFPSGGDYNYLLRVYKAETIGIGVRIKYSNLIYQRCEIHGENMSLNRSIQRAKNAFKMNEREKILKASDLSSLEFNIDINSYLEMGEQIK